jgi:hypothetical protein
VDTTGSGLCQLMFTGIRNVAHLGHATAVEVELRDIEYV